MKTLVIHPEDKTTDFLTTIYKNRGWTEMRNNFNKDDVMTQINNHDRIVMLGHGCSYGLLSHKKIIIHSKHTELLKNKECVFIWCHAKDFVEKNNLNGFYTGMFISEVQEASLYKISTDENEITLSNNLFSNEVRKFVFTDNYIVKKIKMNYNKSGKIIEFNSHRLFYRSRCNKSVHLVTGIFKIRVDRFLSMN